LQQLDGHWLVHELTTQLFILNGAFLLYQYTYVARIELPRSMGVSPLKMLQSYMMAGVKD